jgi:hypothetical protein
VCARACVCVDNYVCFFQLDGGAVSRLPLRELTPTRRDVHLQDQTNIFKTDVQEAVIGATANLLPSESVLVRRVVAPSAPHFAAPPTSYPADTPLALSIS